MTDTAFSYPDPNDTATVTLINQTIVKNNSWEHDERECFDYAKRFLKKGALFIDAGCGHGRLIPEFANYFDKVIAIEPDKVRLGKAIETVASANLTEKVEFMNVPVEDISLSNVADLVVSSHIIQHISRTAVPKVLAKMFDALKKDGILILTTSNSALTTDTFEKHALVNGKFTPENINGAEFEDLINNTDGILPVHEFSYHSLAQEIENVGFRIIAQHPFHQTNQHPDGVDILVIARK